MNRSKQVTEKFVVREKASGKVVMADGTLIDLPKNLKELEEKQEETGSEHFAFPEIFDTALAAFEWHFGASINEDVHSGVHRHSYDYEVVKIRFVGHPWQVSVVGMAS